MTKRTFTVDENRVRDLRYAAAGARAIALQQGDLINDLRQEISFTRSSIAHYRTDKVPPALTEKLDRLLAEQTKASAERNRAAGEYERLQHQLEAVGLGNTRVQATRG